MERSNWPCGRVHDGAASCQTDGRSSGGRVWHEMEGLCRRKWPGQGNYWQDKEEWIQARSPSYRRAGRSSCRPPAVPTREFQLGLEIPLRLCPVWYEVLAEAQLQFCVICTLVNTGERFPVLLIFILSRPCLIELKFSLRTLILGFCFPGCFWVAFLCLPSAATRGFPMYFHNGLCNDRSPPREQKALRRVVL